METKEEILELLKAKKEMRDSIYKNKKWKKRKKALQEFDADMEKFSPIILLKIKNFGIENSLEDFFNFFKEYSSYKFKEVTSKIPIDFHFKWEICKDRLPELSELLKKDPHIREKEIIEAVDRFRLYCPNSLRFVMED